MLSLAKSITTPTIKKKLEKIKRLNSILAQAVSV